MTSIASSTSDATSRYDVVVIGGGPSGLSAALALGRAAKRVLVCDSGPRRNAAAEELHNFVTRDGTPPEEFRRIGREQLARYDVTFAPERVASISGARGAFRVQHETGHAVEARRVLLCTGMTDSMLPIEGFAELWGRSIFQCPYCHGWEIKGARWAILALPASASHVLPFALQARGWSREVTLLTNGAFDLSNEVCEKLSAARVRLETARIARLARRVDAIEAVELEGGARVICDALFTHPPQRQVDLVARLGLALDDDGYVRVDPMTRETSVPGIYASGDLTTRMQAALFAAASGTQAAAMINVELTAELALSGALP